ncbi:GntR family transcriptional regulator [Nocardiopsis composta]
MAGGTRQAAKDRAYAFVKDQVLRGVFEGGDLISEGDVASALEMSRTPIREAFLRLEVEGFLRLYPQRGALVVPVSPPRSARCWRPGWCWSCSPRRNWPPGRPRPGRRWPTGSTPACPGSTS